MDIDFRCDKSSARGEVGTDRPNRFLTKMMIIFLRPHSRLLMKIL